ncbi:TrmB family transcriptional regulator [Natronorubrum sp. JWXQ-INN-674]|uniref:TrmB family transcriptional regulator n=1 Tax=Natronorubrum halalkaliphilum TaxID=2691917 RepID=A0A6B0VPE3_9EURY|nr:helix-turn-helix domain-containing protein [Natronorubrum halalkaliphilum]MXV63125.1 TrmB family transcriptional regulator [Natronorubrum halalkaliphilum]
MPTEEQAVQLLGELGLTEYEARCFVAASRVSTATAAEISDLSDVPRSRVYDALERLHRRGLVDVQQSEPRKYRAISKATALESLQEQYEATIEATDEALSNLQKASDLEESGAWAIADHDHVTNRIGGFLEAATDEIYVLVTDGDLLDQQFLEHLAVADDDVTVRVEVPSEETRDRVQGVVPSATVVPTDLAADPAVLENKWLGRIVMVDRRAVLLGAVTEQPRPGQIEETAIWATGPDHGLVVGLRHLLGARIDSQGVFG